MKAEGKKFISWLLTFFLFSFSSLVLAQDNKEKTYNRNEPYLIQRVEGQVELDGLSDEPAWQNIKPLPLTVHIPNFRGQPSEKTDILVGYDDNYLYVAGRLYDSEPEKIQFPSKKRDDMKLNNDWFGLVIDNFNDNENGLAFFTSPSGLRLDMTVFGDGQGDFPVNQNWNTFWDVKTKRNEEGWFAEIRIPLSSLRFQDRDGRVVMGLITSRYIARKNEWIVFPAIPPNWGFWSPFKPSQAQEVVFEGLSSRKPLYFAPYVLGGLGQSFDLNDLETAYIQTDNTIGELGLDIKYGLTTNLTLDVTLNTDFAQVDADDQQINLTRFSLFFPEKRIFFQERASNFEFNFGGPNRLFYSRRIGIYEEQVVPIYGGVRLVGRINDWDLGFLSMQTAAIEDLPSENFGVFRVRRRIFNPFSYVGSMVTSRIGVDGSCNIAYGLDGIFRVFGDDYLTLMFAQTFENGKENNPLSLDPTRLRISWERRTIKGLGYDLSFSRAGEDYNPGIGFEMREDYSRLGNRLLYGWIPSEESWLLRHNIFLDGSVHFNNEDNSVQSADIGPGWYFDAKSGFFMNIAAKLYHENVEEEFSWEDEADVPAGQYTFYGLTSQLWTPRGRLFDMGGNFDIGSFYDGWRVSLGIQPRWSVSPELELSGFYQFNWIDFPDRNQKFLAHIARLRALVMLSTKFSAMAFIQYNSATGAVVANIRIRFNPREGNDLYIVYNEALNTDRYREIPALPYSSSRAIMLKYTYTFNVR